MSEATLPQPALAGRRAAVSDQYAWLIIALPIAMVPLGWIVDALDIPTNSLTLAANCGLFASLRRHDVATMRNAGHEKGPSLWWVLLQPGYLWQRASILGDTRRLFWWSLAAMSFAIAVAVGANPAVWHTFSGELQCADVGDDVISLFNSIESMKAAGLTARSAHGLTETGSTPSERSCKGYVELAAGISRSVTYTLTKENGKTMIHLRVLPP